jgi:hypothetical protein
MDHDAAEKGIRKNTRMAAPHLRRPALLVAVGLVLLVAGLLGACRVTSPPAGAARAVPSPQWSDDLAPLPPGPVEHLEVAYFHHTVRCDSCIEAERLTRLTLDTYFPAQMESGLVALVSVDVDTGQDAVRVARYAATGPSLYLGITKGGSLYLYPVDFWSVLGSEDQFQDLLGGMIDRILAGQ